MKARLLLTSALAAIALALPAAAQGTPPSTTPPTAAPPATARPMTPAPHTAAPPANTAPAAGQSGAQMHPVTPGSASAGASAGAAGAAGAGMPLTRVQSLVGQNVVGANGQRAGEVEDLLVDGHGQVRAAVIEWGGAFGIGARHAAVPIERLHFGAPNERVRLDMTREQLEQLPRYSRNDVDRYAREHNWGTGVHTFRTSTSR